MWLKAVNYKESWDFQRRLVAFYQETYSVSTFAVAKCSSTASVSLIGTVPPDSVWRDAACFYFLRAAWSKRGINPQTSCSELLQWGARRETVQSVQHVSLFQVEASLLDELRWLSSGCCRYRTIGAVVWFCWTEKFLRLLVLYIQTVKTRKQVNYNILWHRQNELKKNNV